eukprot:scaffold25308_cov124-Isochrysis_galbana.AAC.1
MVISVAMPNMPQVSRTNRMYVETPAPTATATDRHHPWARGSARIRVRAAAAAAAVALRPLRGNAQGAPPQSRARWPAEAARAHVELQEAPVAADAPEWTMRPRLGAPAALSPTLANPPG